LSNANPILIALGTILVIMGVLCALGLLGFLVYLLRQGVQYSVGDLISASLILGIAPSFGTLLTENVNEQQSARIWIGACALTLMVAVYLLYGFYWASIRPGPTRRWQFKQRFAGALFLAVIGSLSMLIWEILKY
jgi:hypothetical protein